MARCNNEFKIDEWMNQWIEPLFALSVQQNNTTPCPDSTAAADPKFAMHKPVRNNYHTITTIYQQFHVWTYVWIVRNHVQSVEVNELGFPMTF